MILGFDGGGETAMLGVAVQQTLPIGLRHVGGEHRAGAQPDLAVQLLVVHRMIALEGDAV